jgi:hypothetical protein
LKGRTLYEEVWECRFPKKLTIEEVLLSLNVLDPHLAEDIHSLFSEAVADSLANVLEESGARALMRLIGKPDFEGPTEVYEVLDSVLKEGSEVLKTAIVEEFCASLQLLLEKFERNLAADANAPAPDRDKVLGVAK